MDLGRFIPEIGVIIGLVIAYFIFMQVRRAKNAKAVVDHLFCDITTDIGTSYSVLLPIQGNSVVDENHEFEYIVNESACYDTEYPPGKSKLEQVKARKAYYHEGNPEPRIKRTDEPLITSAVLFSKEREKATKIAMQMSNEMKSDLDILKKGLINPLIVYIILLVLAVISIASVVISYQNGELIKTIAGIK